MKTLLDVLVENHEMYCLSFRCVLVNKSFIFRGVVTDHTEWRRKYFSPFEARVYRTLRQKWIISSSAGIRE